ncbi:ribosome small subunit-dependent GTPase A [Mollicutes bacterium LVI A0078]|nr:ribosome small subunit-dependent GTPase A [Mollicutes bacterium LVI A0075]WOO90791.1 ribosome small subunit-dependent GTPase A [Mollicutes bacterium LVI A0078]
MKDGIIIRALAGFFYVLIDGEILECKASKKLKGKNKKLIVGDYVEVDVDAAYITKMHPRENELVRPLISNVQNSFLVFSVTEPVMNFGLLDRMISLMEINGLKTTIILTKCDLLPIEELQELKLKLNYYEQIGYNLIYQGFDDKPTEVTDLLSNDKYVITGQTGVGKSTLVNKIIPDLNLQTQEISKVLGRGKHTTREVTFYKYENSYLIDTPGFSSLDLNFDPEIVRDSFIEFFELSSDCKFNGCNHLSEPKCAVKAKVESGEILKSRYENYVKLMEIAKEGKWKKY